MYKFCIAALIFIIGTAAWGDPPIPKASLFFDADQYSSRPDKTVELKGHVKFIQGTVQLTCDYAVINTQSLQIYAKGDVILISPNEFIKAESIDYNYGSKKGIIRNGFIQTGQSTLEGEEIFKLGENDYEARGASYTTCINCPPSWKISGSKVEATAGKYAYITNPVFRIYNAPVFWLPYAVLPIKNERQSGLLAPSYTNSDTDGFTLSGSYFWAIDRSHDMTYTATNYKNRGLKGSVEYRYVADENSRGNFLAHYLHDGVYAGDSRYLTPDRRYWSGTARERNFSTPRYALHYDHHFELPENFANNMNLNLVKDSDYVNDFPKDFPSAFPANGQTALENRMNISKNTENAHASMDVDIYQDLIKADPVGQNEDAIHRVPELKYSYTPFHIFNTGFVSKFDFNYLNLSRFGKTYDSVSGANTFQLGTDRYRTGQRISATPSISYPFHVGDIFDVVPEVSYDETFYQFGYSPKPTTSRRYTRYSIQTKTRFSAIFGDETQPKSNKYKHEIEPTLSYTIVPDLYQEDHPFFGTKNQKFAPNFTSTQPLTEFDTLQFDYRDRVADRNLFTYGLTNKIIRKTPDGQYREIIRHKLSQSYDIFSLTNELRDDSGNTVAITKQPWSEIKSLLEVKLDYFNLTNDLSFYPYQNMAAHSSSIGIKDEKKNGVAVSYTQSFTFQVDPSTGLPLGASNISSRSESVGLSLFLVTKILELAGTAGYDILTGKMTSAAANGILMFPGKCWGVSFSYERYFTNPNARMSITPTFFFDEETKLGPARPVGL